MNTSPQSTHNQGGVDALKTLRDEIRLQLHLASMEAKARWKTLEPKIADAERLETEASDTSRRAFQKILDEVKDFRRQHLKS